MDLIRTIDGMSQGLKPQDFLCANAGAKAPAYPEAKKFSGAVLALPLLCIVLLCGVATGQTPVVPVPSASGVPVPSAPTPDVAKTQSQGSIVTGKTPPQSMPVADGTEIDRVVAIVNGELILDSDVDQERRFAALLPYGEAGGTYTREKALERLINRELILQQEKLQPQAVITTAAAAKDLNSLRPEIPACRGSHCETQAGWDKFLASQGFTEASLTELWRQRMVVLGFIERRFRMGIKVSNADIQTYYQKTMLPLYAAQHATPPPVESIAPRIQEVLLQQQVSNLLSDWLQSLRAQGSVVVLHPGEVAP